MQGLERWQARGIGTDDWPSALNARLAVRVLGESSVPIVTASVWMGSSSHLSNGNLKQSGRYRNLVWQVGMERESSIQGTTACARQCRRALAVGLR